MDILLYVLIGFFVLAIVIGLAVANFAGENLLTIYDRYSRQNISFLNTIEFANIVNKGGCIIFSLRSNRIFRGGYRVCNIHRENKRLNQLWQDRICRFHQGIFHLCQYSELRR